MAALDDVAHLFAVEDDDPAVRAAEREELRAIVAEIGRLPERQRLALVMRELEGATHVQMSTALGTSIPATQSLLVRARAQLQEALAASGRFRSARACPWVRPRWSASSGSE